MSDLRHAEFFLSGILPDLACINCRDTKDVAIVPYAETSGSPMLAVLLLCGLCRAALRNRELGVHIDVRIRAEDGWV